MFIYSTRNDNTFEGKTKNIKKCKKKVDREEFETDRATNSQSPDLHKGGWIKMGAIQAFPTCFHLGHDRVVEEIIIF